MIILVFCHFWIVPALLHYAPLQLTLMYCCLLKVYLSALWYYLIAIKYFVCKQFVCCLLSSNDIFILFINDIIALLGVQANMLLLTGASRLGFEVQRWQDKLLKSVLLVEAKLLSSTPAQC